MRFFNFDVGSNNLRRSGNFLFLIDTEDKGGPDIGKLGRYTLSEEARAYLETFFHSFKTFRNSQIHLPPIYRVCKSGNLPYVKLLLPRTTKIHKPIQGIRPILAAAKAGQWRIVEYLLRRFSPKRPIKKESRNLDVTTPSPDGETVLTLTSRNGQKEIVRLLLDDYEVEDAN